MSIDFAAIDFETATSQRNSACSVGVVVVENGEIKERYHSLIKPPDNEYLPFNIIIHGIKPEMTQDAPEFGEIWPDVVKLLKGRRIFAHNCSFDASVLKESLAFCGVNAPQFEYSCSVQLAKAVWKDLPSYKLNRVASFLDISFNHHDALADAYACASIVIKACEEFGCRDVNELVRRAVKAK